MCVLFIFIALLFNINNSEITCANVRCSGPCLDSTEGPKCCSLDEGCAADDYNKNNCMQCGDVKYDNECYAICDGNDVATEQCSPCEPDSNCKTAGCSGELCVAKDSDISASICVFKCEYKCKKFQTCGQNEAGDCVWTTNASDVANYETCMNICKSTSGDKPDNSGRPKICKCTKEYNPICCNGKTYSNPCNADCNGIPAEKQGGCKMGECPKICACQDIYEPVCCNGTKYSNKCMAECKGEIGCVEGECKEL